MYNALPYVEEAIESIIHQTFQDWELLVINDTSTDGSPDIVSRYAAKDRRIKLIDNNTGLKGDGPARNCGIDQATGEYIAMMDADDISLPQRLAEQVRFMDKHRDIELSGCWIQCFGNEKQIHWSPPFDLILKSILCFYDEPWGATIIFRRNAVKDRYIQSAFGADTLFTTKVALRHRVSNIPKILYRYRVHSASATRSTDHYPFLKGVFQELLPLRLGFIPNEQQIDTHLIWRFGSHAMGKNVSLLVQIRWLILVLTKGKYSWKERIVLATLCVLKTTVKALRSVKRVIVKPVVRA
jgi:glycosyltransferase involved in cell wall biosynthesis